MKIIKTDVVIVGSGAGGSTIAKELAAKGTRVLILEKGPEPNPAKKHLMEKISSKYREGILIHSISRTFKTLTGMDRNIPIHYRTGIGGTTTLTSANAVRSLEDKLNFLHIDVKDEFQEIERELNVTPFPEELMGKGTKKLLEASHFLGIRMDAMPKCMDFSKCCNCIECRWIVPKM